MNDLLGFCIPTYNRKDSLKLTLESLLSQIKDYAIPIYISDNNFEDGTKEMIEDFSRKYPFVFYRRQEFNKGIDINMIDVIKMATTKYAWLLGEDDSVVEGGVKYIYSLLENNDLSLILVNGYERDFSKNVWRNVWEKTDFKDLGFSDYRLMFERYFYKLPHFANLIINVYKINEEIFVESERFIGTFHAYVGLTLDCLAEELLKCGRNRILTVSDPMIYLGATGVEKTWTNEWHKIILFAIPELFRKIHVVYVPYVEEALRLYWKTYIGRTLISSSVLFLKFKVKERMSLFNSIDLVKYLPLDRKLLLIFVLALPTKISDVLLDILERLLNLCRTQKI